MYKAVQNPRSETEDKVMQETVYKRTPSRFVYEPLVMTKTCREGYGCATASDRCFRGLVYRLSFDCNSRERGKHQMPTHPNRCQMKMDFGRIFLLTV